MSNQDQIPEDEGIYVISVASQLSGLHPQTLRQYDRLGLVTPNRTVEKIVDTHY
jgi:MerR family transcriptional regulator/heat shock protein HspR